MIPSKVKSTRFLAELKKRVTSFKGKKELKGTIEVGDNLQWWYWLEFGTAARGEPGHASGVPYEIAPTVNTDAIRFFPKEGGIAFADHFLFMGIRPRAFVRKVLPDIHNMTKEKITKALIEGQFRMSTIKVAMVKKVMPEAKAIIAASLAIEAPGESETGRLHGGTAAEAFIAEAEIKTE